jgi:hypothetical protein
VHGWKVWVLGRVIGQRAAGIEGRVVMVGDTRGRKRAQGWLLLLKSRWRAGEALVAPVTYFMSEVRWDLRMVDRDDWCWGGREWYVVSQGRVRHVDCARELSTRVGRLGGDRLGA